MIQTTCEDSPVKDISTNLVPASNTQVATMSSREIAELTGKEHKNVKRTIETLMGKGVIRDSQFENFEYINNLGIPCVGKEYRLEKRDSFVVVAQLSPEFTARLVDRWQELEAQAAKPALQMARSHLNCVVSRIDTRFREDSSLTISRERFYAVRNCATGSACSCV